MRVYVMVSGMVCNATYKVCSKAHNEHVFVYHSRWNCCMHNVLDGLALDMCMSGCGMK